MTNTYLPGIKLTEKEIQDQIRDAVSYTNAELWRVNTLAGFAGKYQRNANGSITIQNPSFVKTGVPKGFPDLIGIKPVIITEDMIGKTLGVFVFIEVKTENGVLSSEQREIHREIEGRGGIGGVARSVEDALRILNSWK